MSESLTFKQMGLMDFSPIKKDDNNKENDIPVLSLIQFSKAPFVTFGSVKLGTSKSAILRIENPVEDALAVVTIEKIPSPKGFSVDQIRFTVEPKSSTCLTITWTPTEEGGIRELIVFNANGVLRHRAILLGRAEAPKKKKKCLWDSIKNKKTVDSSATPRGQKAQSSLKIAANKTLQVSRQQQYRREKPRSPLASLNKRWDVDNTPSVQKNSPVVLLVPATRLTNPAEMSPGSPSAGDAAEHKEMMRMLNRTLSPVGTPEKFIRLMPRIQSVERPVLASVEGDRYQMQTEHPVMSVIEALALIDSDLPHVCESSPNPSSSSEFSDSLESVSGNCGQASGKSAARMIPDTPEMLETNEQRQTFFVTRKPVASRCVLPEVNVDDSPQQSPTVKKASFTSVTVTKSKPTTAPIDLHISAGRKIKRSRRKLLEKTLELSDSISHCESSPSPSSLPVIDTHTRSGRWRCSHTRSAQHDSGQPAEHLDSIRPIPVRDGPPVSVTFLEAELPIPAIFPFSLPSSSNSAPSQLSTQSPPPIAPFSTPCQWPARSDVSKPPVAAGCPPLASAAPSVQTVFVPVRSQSKKRKSEDFMKYAQVGVTGQVKRSKGAAVVKEPPKAKQEKRNVSQGQLPKPAGFLRSSYASAVKTTKSVVSAQAKKSRSNQASKGVQSFGTPLLKTSKVVAVAQSKFTFMKSAQKAIPRHPMPFAAKNMFYDERWIEKQERAFTWWINYVLTPDDFKVSTEVAKVNAVSIAVGSDDQFNVTKAPTKEEMSFSTYMARRRLNRLRRSACQLFTCEDMVKAIQKLEFEVEAKRLLVRKDRHLWKDIGERQKVLNWLVSYNPLWLRIGLETIFGELISLESNSDVLGLALFILRRLLWNPDIAAAYRHAKVPNLYKDGHEEALSRFTLKKLLLLVCFLDKAKESRLIEHDPCLFCMDAEFKTSKGLLLAFSRDFLSGEGILPRHLSYLGLPVSHVQTPLDEFNFAVKNLAVDLKCGIRLVRVVELFIQDWSLSRRLRLPAISRLQKIHNVDVAFQVLQARGIELKDECGNMIDSRDIVDGHREKTLSLLWKIILAFQVEVILDEVQLREEISFLKRTLRFKQKLASLRADQGLQQKPARPSLPFEHNSAKIQLLMEWVNAVCDFYNLKAENFTVSFSDGRVLCYLIHHYHPDHLPEEAVSHCTTQTVECALSGRVELDRSATDSDSSLDSWQMDQNGLGSSCVEFKELLENERNNFRLVSAAVGYLGGVPAMISPADMSNTIPSEKVVMSYLSFLCARLLDLRKETRAARVIQGAWRTYRLKKALELYQERNLAAGKIQVAVRGFLQRCRVKRRNSAAIVIQAHWRGYLTRNAIRVKREAQLRVLRNNAAAVIQAQWRMYSTMRTYQRLRYYSIITQAQWRMRQATVSYRKILCAAKVIQNRFRAWSLAKSERQRYLSLRAAVITAQRVYQRRKAHRLEQQYRAATVIQTTFWKWYKARMTHKNTAALKIQSWFRMCSCLRRYARIKRSALLIQAVHRGRAQRRIFHMLKIQQRAAVVIQSVYRGQAVRKDLSRKRRAAVAIQRRFRASCERDAVRQRFVRMRCAAVAIQAAFRGHAARALLRERHRSATVIQAAYRRLTAERRYLALRQAAVNIQRQYRANRLSQKAKGEYDALRHAALIVQAMWRGRTAREKIKKLYQAATTIQAHFHRYKALTHYRAMRAATVVIQQHFRACVAGKVTRLAYLQMKAATVALQAAFRGMKSRTELKKKHQAATVIQSFARMAMHRKQYLLLQSATIIIQCRYRAFLEGTACQFEYRRLRQATVNIQAAYRGYRVREELKEKHNAAKVIQAHFRMHKVRMSYLAAKLAATILQERYRAKRLRDHQVERFGEMRRAAVVIQAAFRGHQARLQIAEIHRAATVMQRRFIAIRDRRQFLAIKAAALACQKRYRNMALAKQDRLEYLLKRSAAISLQAAYRGMKIRQQLYIQLTAAVTIQSYVRRYLEQTQYKKLRWAASTVQSLYRANKKMKEEMRALDTKRCAAVKLQAAFRGMKLRRIMRQKQHAAIAIQRAYRTYNERKQYLSLKSSVLAVQRRYRATLAARQQMQQYQRLCKAVVTLQAAYRGQKMRKQLLHQHQAATVIQAAFRRHREEVKFQAMRLSAIIIQSRFRASLLQRRDRDHFLKMKHSTVVLQAAFRGFRVRNNNARMHRAATVIQAHFKRHKEQMAFNRQRWAAIVVQRRFLAQKQRRFEVKNYQTIRAAVVKLQAAYRGMKSRQTVSHMHKAASAIQRGYRAYQERKQYLSLKSNVVAVQRRYRATLAARQQMQQYQRLCKAVVTLQAAYRGQKMRQQLLHQHQAATVIQAALRRHREEVKFQAMRLSAIIIQSRFRASLLQRRDRDHFLKMKHSTVVLQAAFRGFRVRNNNARMQRAATVIQAHFKRHKDQLAFNRLRWAAIVVQRRFLAQKQRRFEVKNYQMIRAAVVKLQAAYRGMKSRQTVSHMHKAASAIQRGYRAYQERKQYLSLKSSVLAVQRRYRATLAARQQMQQYQRLYKAVVTLQAAYRGQKMRQQLLHQHQAATVIQAAFRRHREEVKFQAMRLSAIIIQSRFRASLLQRRDRDHFLKMKHSTVVLQAAFRGFRVRNNNARMQRAATVIQAHFKRHKEQMAFNRLRWAAIVVQRRFIAQKQRRFEVKNYQMIRAAVVKLQAAYRGMKSRQTLSHMHKAASAIQRGYRAYQERKQYLSLKSNVVAVQRRYRATLAARQQMQQYQRLCKAVVTLQAAYRGQKMRKQLLHQHQAATVIQAAFRRHREEVKFQAMRLSAIIIQSRFRASLHQRRDRDHFLKMKHSTVVLQAAFRGFRVRNNNARMHRAATVIQAHFKRHKEQMAFNRQRWAAIVVQRRFLAQKQRRFEVKNYQTIRAAVVKLQAAYRGMKSRQTVSHMHKAASAIQRGYRAYQERKQYLSLKSNVVVVQRRYRATLAARQQMQQYQRLCKAVVTLQAAYRGQKMRKQLLHQHQAATVIQAAFRRHREEVKFQAMRLSAIIIQSRFRASLLQRRDRDHFLKMKHSTVVLQAAFRGFRVRNNNARMHRAATVIQAHFKRHKEQMAFNRLRWAAIVVQRRFLAQKQRRFEVKNYQMIRAAVVKLQAAYRGIKSRQTLSHMHKAASAIQRGYRAYQERKQYLSLKSNVVVVQRRYRATLAARQQMQQYQRLCKAVVTLQAAYRGQKMRKQLLHQHQAATVIQAAFRRHREEVKFQAMRLSAIIIQSRFRASLLQRRDRHHFLKMKLSAIVIQAAFRGHCARRVISRQNEAASLIQSCWRCAVQRRIFLMKKDAAIILQRWFRSLPLARANRDHFDRVRQAAVVIQAHCRGWIARRQALQIAMAKRRLRFSAAIYHHLCAAKIQRAWRVHRMLQFAKRQVHSVITIQRWVRTMQQRRRYMEDRAKVIKAQRVVRRWLARRRQAALIIQKSTKRFLLFRRQQRVERAITKAQALWRGHCARLKNDHAKLVRVRHRLRKVSANVQEEDKLCNKMSSALDYLLRYKHFSYILEALKKLEAATRLSPECCERLVDSGATLVIFTLIRSCNRSVPCMEVISFSIQILLNLSKYHKTIVAVYAVENSVETLLDLLQRYREKAGDKVADKGGSIFTKACFLLALLLQDQQRALEVRSLPMALERIRSIFSLTARKHKMDAERSFVKQKINASISGSFLVQTTPRKSRPMQKYAPDWVLRKDKLKDIVDPLRAIQMVANTLLIVM